MQLLRDNLTLWTSSETGDVDEATPQKEESKPAEPKAEEPAPVEESK